MVGSDFRLKRPSNWIQAALYCAILALVIGYALSYLQMRLGVGVISGPGKVLTVGPAALSRAGLNLYAIHHITLLGSGAVASELGDSSKVHASLSLPITLWISIPIVALLIGGYSAGRMRSGANRLGMILPAVLGGLIYATVLACCARFVSARLESFLLPEMGGISADPPMIPFAPSVVSTWLYAAIFGVVFTYLGALIAVRESVRSTVPGRWWACGKAAVIGSLIVQILIAGAIQTIFIVKQRTETGSDEKTRITEMLPAAAGLGYTAINGATLTGGVETLDPIRKVILRPIDAKLNLYTIKGTLIKQAAVSESANVKKKPMSKYAYIVVLLAALAIIGAGWMAVRMGSTDGSIPTAARFAVIHTVYVYALLGFSSLVFSMTDAASKFAVFIKPEISAVMIVSPLVIFILSLAGAYLAQTKRSSGVIGF